MIGCGVQAAQQFSGINTCMYYGPSIMLAAGVHIGNYNANVSAIVTSVPLALTNAIGSVIAIFVVDRFGRRWIMLRMLPLMTISLMLVGFAMFAVPEQSDTTTTAGNLALTGLCFFLLFYGTGMGSTPWIVCSEIFPLHVAGTANSLTSTTNWLSNFVVAWFFPLMLNQPTLKGWAFILLAFFAFVSFVFVYLMLPETANKSIAEILKAILGNSYQEDKEPSAVEQTERDLKEETNTF